MQYLTFMVVLKAATVNLKLFALDYPAELGVNRFQIEFKRVLYIPR